MRNYLSRRDFLKVLGLGSAGAAAALALAGCAGDTTGTTTGGTTGGTTTGGSTGTTTGGTGTEVAGDNIVLDTSAGTDKTMSVIGDYAVTTGDLLSGDELAAAVSTKDTLTIRIDGDPSTFEGAKAVSNALICGSFCEAKLQTTTYDKNMADVVGFNDRYTVGVSAELDEDEMGVTMGIREGVTWSDGTPFTIEDVLHSIDQYRTMSRYDYVDFDNVTKVDDTHFNVRLKRKYAGAIAAVGGFQMINKKVHESVGPEVYFTTESYVTLGAWKITKWVTGDSIEMTARNDYFGGTPKIQNVIVRFIPEASVAMMELETGGIDVVDVPNWTDVQNVINGSYEGVAKYYKCRDRFDNYLGFNMSKGSPYADIRVRQAVCYAIDREELLIGAYEGLCSPTYTIWTGNGEFLTTFTEEEWPYHVDLDKAKSLLAEAGYPDGFKSSIMTNQKADQGLCIQLIKNQLAKIGIELELLTYDSATYSDLMANDPTAFGLWLRNWTAGVVWDTAVTTTMATNCHPQEDDPVWIKYRDWAVKFAGIMDDAEREKEVRAFQENFLTEALFVYHLNMATKNTILVENLMNLERAGYTFFALDAHFA